MMRKRGSNDGLGDTRLIVTGIVVVAFLALFAYMVRAADSTKEVEWSRLVYLFGSAEAIAFSALGWLFGREVHRERAENAEKQAAEATAKAGEAKSQAASAQAKGEAFAESIRALGSAEVVRSRPVTARQSEGDEGDEFLAEGEAKGTRADYAALVDLADRLFPSGPPS
jgi:hypothetical protein